MNLEKDLAAAKEIVLEAGENLRKHFGNIEATHSKSERAVDVVTQLDVDTENLIATSLQKYDPTIGFRGEEKGVRHEGSRFWLTDPIDGTAHFIRGIPFCTTMVSQIENGGVNLAIIYNFVTNELYETIRGQGARLNGQEIHVSNRPLSDAYLFYESNMVKQDLINTYLKLKKVATPLTTINCGYEYGLIASGKIEGRICANAFGKDWDYAPGSLLVQEAGGTVANLGKTTYDYTNHDFLAVNPKVYKELTEGKDALFPNK